MSKLIRLKEVPKKDIKNGLLVHFATDTKDSYPFAFADIHKHRIIYDYPQDERKVLGVYIKIK